MSFDLVTFPKVRQELAAFTGDIQGAELLPKHLRNRPADVFLTIMTGHELGMSPMQSIRAIHVIEGKPTLSADLMGALAMARRDVCEYLRPVELSAAVATYETKRVGWPESMRMSFTMEDAQRAGLTNKDNWKKYPAAMLKSRCLAAIVRAAYPDLMLGIYDPDELEPSAEPRNVTAHVVDVTPPPKTSTKMKERLSAPPADDTAELIDAIAAQLKDLGSTEADLRALIDVEQGTLPPPVAKWKAESCRIVLAKLRNGWGEKLRALANADAAPPAYTDDDNRDAG